MGHSIKGWINITAADCVRVADDIHLVERRRKRRRNKDLMKHPNSLVNPIRQLSTLMRRRQRRDWLGDCEVSRRIPYMVLLQTALTGGPAAMEIASQ